MVINSSNYSRWCVELLWVYYHFHLDRARKACVTAYPNLQTELQSAKNHANS